MTASRTYTISTRLNRRHNTDLIEYLQEYRVLYGKMLRFTWHRYTPKGATLHKMSKSQFNTLLQSQFGVSKRLANAVIYEAEGTYRALAQLKRYELEQLGHKIKGLKTRREKLRAKVEALKKRARQNNLSPAELKYYKRQKRKLFLWAQRLNRLAQRRNSLEAEIKSGDLSLCFGSKKLFRAQFNLKANKLTSHQVWLERFRSNQDNRTFFIGSKDETWRNQILQLKPLPNVGRGTAFAIQLRKKAQEAKRSYAEDYCEFKHMGDILAKLLLSKEHGVSYRIVFRGSKCYLQAMITIEQSPSLTRRANGVIGLDFNAGFIQMAETDRAGNLTGLRRYEVKSSDEPSTGSSKNRLQIREAAAHIASYALSVGKDIVLEDLDFSKTKSMTAKAKTDKGKEYNKMVHRLDYSQYKDAFENCCFKRGIGLIKVNPAYTSQIAKRKYCQRMKLTVHEGAAMVIARRAQGYADCLAS